jgi:large subunit ribosomal protein L13
VPTYSPKPADIQRSWHVVDADGAVLGRMASEVARILRGKHKPIYAPHVDCGDHVIVVNAEKVFVTSNKDEDKEYFRYSGYPGGLSRVTLRDQRERHPDRVVRAAVKGMLPKGRLGRQMMGKLKIYAGPTHPHAAQQPKVLDLLPSARKS